MTEKRFTLHSGLDTLNIMDNTKFNEHIYINKSSKRYGTPCRCVECSPRRNPNIET